MITIQESNLYAFITTDTDEELAFVKNALTYTRQVKTYSKRPITVSDRFYFNRNGQVVTYRSILGELLIAAHEREYRCMIHKYESKLPELLPEQREDAIVGLRDYQVEAFDSAIAANGGILWMATNAGKTEVAGAILKAYPQLHFLYLVHRIELLDQTEERFQLKFGLSVSKLTSDQIPDGANITIAMIQTLHRRLEEYSDFLMGIDGIIADECQHYGGKMAEAVVGRCTSATFRLGLTGTVPEAIVDRLNIQRFFGRVSYKIRNKDLIEQEYSSDIRIFMVKGNWDDTGVAAEIKKLITLERIGISTNLWNEVCNIAIVNNAKRNEAIVETIHSILRSGGTGILVFVDIIDHGQQLSDLSGMPFVSAGSEDRSEAYQQFKSGETPCLITSPILDEGIDVSRIHYIILANGKKSRIRILQRIGRGLRKETGKTCMTVFDFYDDETGMIEKHTKERIETYRQEGFRIEEVNLIDVDKIINLSNKDT